MGEVLACRLCLATHVKLFNMFKYRLDSYYENVTGFQLTQSDYIQDVCSMCSVLLVKTDSFRQMCQNSQELLRFAEMHQHLISTEYIESLKLNSSFLKLTVKNSNEIIECVHADERIKEERNAQKLTVKKNHAILDCVHTKEETTDDAYWNTWEHEDLILAKEESSDEEPLSAKIVSVTRKAAIKLEKEKKLNDNSITNKNNEVKSENYSDIDDDSNDFPDGEVDVLVLTKDQQIDDIQSRKTSLNYLNSFYKCDHCFKGFITDLTYKNHMIRHDPSFGPHECEVCHTRWSTGSRLRSHVTTHERKYVCRLCDTVTRSKHQAKEHSNWHHGHTFECKFCGASFTKSTSHLTHLRLQHPSKHTCNICGESFIGVNGLKQHKKKVHWDKKSEPKADSCCAHCNVEFQNVEAYERHISNSKEDTCDPDLRACVQCGEGFRTEEDFKKHLKDHSKEEPVKCGECSRTFAQERSYALHYRRAHLRSARARPQPAPAHVVCEVCGKKCISNATLRYHQRIHTGEKPYQCTECPKRFSVLQRLQIHQRTHTGERPYVCPLCPKAFKHKAALNRHDRVHTGAKPYSCSHCGKSFSQSNSLKGHIKTVHLKMPSPYRPRRVPVD